MIKRYIFYFCITEVNFESTTFFVIINSICDRLIVFKGVFKPSSHNVHNTFIHGVAIYHYTTW